MASNFELVFLVSVILLVVILVFLYFRKSETKVAPFNDGNNETPTSTIRSDSCSRGSFLKLSSPNGQYELSSNRDNGNIGLYKGDFLIWTTKLPSRAGERACMSSIDQNGNLVLYTADGELLWSTPLDPNRVSGPYTLGISDDSSIYILDGLSQLRWTTGPTIYPNIVRSDSSSVGGKVKKMSSADGHYMLISQEDGNLVIYDNRTTLIAWSSKSGQVAQAGVETWLQCDGNLVTYHSNGSLPWWNSGTAGVGAGAYSLELHKGGYLTISDATGVYIWQSNYSAMVDSDDFQGRFNQLVSRNKQFMAYISPAGALEVRHNMTGLSYSSLSTQSFGKLSETGASGITSGPFYGRIQSDGNLVVYSSMGSSVWSSATTSSAVSVSLLLTDTGKLVIISHDQDGDRDIWRSIPDQSDVLKALETRYIESRNGAYYFAVNPTGVFGMYRTSTGDMLWGNSTPFDSSAKTNYEFKILGREYGYVFALNPIGQSVIWFEAGQNSLTGLVPAGNVGKGVFTKTFDPLVGLSEPLYFKVENDGRLVKYDSTGTAVWTTG